MGCPKTSPTASSSGENCGSAVATCAGSALTVKLLGGKGYDIIIDVGGDVADPATPNGEHRFQLDDCPEELRVVIAIARPAWARVGATHGPVDETESIVLRLRKIPDGPHELERGHPRVTLTAAGGAGGTPSTTRLEVDVRFLRVTPHFLRGGAMVKPTSQSVNPRLGALDPNADTESDMDRRRSKNAHLELYELTTGESPKLWAVTWPNACHLAGPYEVMLFMMPKGVEYRNPSEAVFDSLQRYLLTPPRAEPFFIWAPVNNDSVADSDSVDLAAPLGNPPAPLADEFDLKELNISGAFIDQVVESGKKVLLVLPMPNGGGGAAWGPLTTKTGSLTNHVYALRRALHALAAPTTMVSHKVRAALGGFSAGAPSAYLALAQNRATFDGFFWFDPVTSDSQATGLREWLDGNGKRKVWLIGGVHYSALDTFAKALDRPANVKLMPSSSSHYTAAQTAYSRGISEPPGCPNWKPLRLDPVAFGWQGSVYSATRVFGDVLGPQSLTLKVESERSIVTKPVKASLYEALGLLVFKFRRQSESHRRVDDESELADLVAFIENDITNTRHQWVIGGGEVFAERGAGFVSFLGACVREWAT